MSPPPFWETGQVSWNKHPVGWWIYIQIFQNGFPTGRTDVNLGEISLLLSSVHCIAFLYQWLANPPTWIFHDFPRLVGDQWLVSFVPIQGVLRIHLPGLLKHFQSWSFQGVSPNVMNPMTEWQTLEAETGPNFIIRKFQPPSDSTRQANPDDLDHVDLCPSQDSAGVCGSQGF